MIPGSRYLQYNSSQIVYSLEVNKLILLHYYIPVK